MAVESRFREAIVALIDSPTKTRERVYEEAARAAYGLSAEILRKLATTRRTSRCARVPRVARMRALLRPWRAGEATGASAGRPGPSCGTTSERRPDDPCCVPAAIHVERLRSHVPEKEPDEDLRHEALAAALDHAGRIEDDAVRDLTFPERIDAPALPVPSLCTSDLPDGTGQRSGRGNWALRRDSYSPHCRVQRRCFPRRCGKRCANTSASVNLSNVAAVWSLSTNTPPRRLRRRRTSALRKSPTTLALSSEGSIRRLATGGGRPVKHL